jgi:hypothetical protein
MADGRACDENSILLILKTEIKMFKELPISSIDLGKFSLYVFKTRYILHSNTVFNSCSIRVRLMRWLLTVA